MNTTSVRNVVFVLWGGHLGGAERHTVEICRLMRSEFEVDARVLFIEHAGRSSDALDTLGIPWHALELARGSAAVLHPALLAESLTELGADAAFLGYGGYLARTARTGGYRGVLISVEHGGILQVPSWTPQKKVKEAVSRAIGENALDGTICVSDLITQVVLAHPHAPSVRRIYNGVDVERYHPSDTPPTRPVFGHAGRLIEGKGVLNVVRAFDAELAGLGCRLRIAGDGPACEEARAIVSEKGLGDAVEFLGVIDDMPAFWRSCSVVLHPTTPDWKESFCLAVVEAMATGLPAVVSSVGALPEIVADGVTGTVVPPADVGAIHAAMLRYATEPGLLAEQAAAARTRVEQTFELRRAVREYLSYATELADRSPS